MLKLATSIATTANISRNVVKKSRKSALMACAASAAAWAPVRTSMVDAPPMADRTRPASSSGVTPGAAATRTACIRPAPPPGADASTCCSAPAVLNAIAGALGPLRLDQVPMTPERLLDRIEESHV